MHRPLVVLCGVAALLACEVDGWVQLGGVRAFRQVDRPEALELLEESETSVVQLRGRPRAPTLPGARVLEPGDPLPEEVLDAGRILVVAADAAAGRRLSAQLVRAGARRVALVVGDPVELGAPPSPLLARPLKR